VVCVCVQQRKRNYCESVLHVVDCACEIGLKVKSIGIIFVFLICDIFFLCTTY